MNHLIHKIDLPSHPRTGVIEERELFAKMMAEEIRQRRAARRARLLTLLGWRLGTRETAPPVPSRLSRKTARPTRAADSAAGIRATSR